MPSASSPLSPTSDASALPLSDQDLPTLSDTDSMPSDWTPSSPSASHLRSSNSDSEEESFDLVSSCEGSAASSGGMRLSFPDPLAEARGEEERRREEEEDASYSFLLDAVPERKAAGTISEWVRATKEGERGTEKSVPRSEGLVDVDEVEAKVVETEGPPARTTTTITGTLRIAFIGGCKTSQTVLLDRFARVSLALSVVPLSSSPPLVILLLDPSSPLPHSITHLASETTFSLLPLLDSDPADSPSASLDSLSSAQTVRPKSDDSHAQLVTLRALAREVRNLELGERIVRIERSESVARTSRLPCPESLASLEEVLGAEDGAIFDAVRELVEPVQVGGSLGSSKEDAEKESQDLIAEKVDSTSPATTTEQPYRSLLSRATLVLAIALLLASLSLLDTTPSFSLSIPHSHAPTPIPLFTPSASLHSTLPEPCALSLVDSRTALSIVDSRTALAVVDPRTAVSIFHRTPLHTRPTQRTKTLQRRAERKAIRRAKRVAVRQCSRSSKREKAFVEEVRKASREMLVRGRRTMEERKEVVARAARGARKLRSAIGLDARVVGGFFRAETAWAKVEAARMRGRLVVGGSELRERFVGGGEVWRAKFVKASGEWRGRMIGEAKMRVGRAARGLGRIRRGQVGMERGRIFVRRSEEVSGCERGRREGGTFSFFALRGTVGLTRLTGSVA